MKQLLITLLFYLFTFTSSAQIDTLVQHKMTDSSEVVFHEYRYLDTALRIINLSPYFTIHVDSLLNYDLKINKEPQDYFWFLVNSPVGVRIDRSTGNLFFKAEKAYFKSGRLKYDLPYKVILGVQNLRNPTDRVDTSFTILFYSTEVNSSKLKPTATSIINAEEGDVVQFRMLCEEGTFPIEQITLNSSMSLANFSPVRKCGDDFKWEVPFGIFKEGDTAKQKIIILEFISNDKFYNKDTSVIRIQLKPGINYPVRNLQHKQVSNEMSQYIQKLKLAFYVVSKNVKNNRRTRTTFDITGSTTAFAGTVVSTTAETGSNSQKIGRILPSIGLTLVPVKEAIAPNKLQEQNTATQVRAEARRLDFFLSDNRLAGEKDLEVLVKTKRLQDELKKSRLQFVDLPMLDNDVKLTDADADRYFKDPKVNKKYKLKVN